MLYNSLQINRVYMSQKEFNFPKGDPIGKKNAVFLCTPTFLDSLNLLEDPLIHLKECHYTRYIIDTVYRQIIGQKTIRENQTKYMKDTFSVNACSKDFAFILSNLKENTIKKKPNIIVDLGHWNDLFFKYKKNMYPELILRTYFEFILSKINDSLYNGYKKILLIPIHQWMDHGIKEFGVNKDQLNNPISMLLLTCYKFPELSQMLKNLDIYLINTKSKNLIILNDESLNDKKNFMKIKREFEKLAPVSNTETDDKTEITTSNYQNTLKNPTKHSEKMHLDPKKDKNEEEITNKNDSDDNDSALSRKNTTDIDEKDTKNDENRYEELDDNINTYFSDSDEFDDTDITDLDEEHESENLIKKNTFIANFRPEFSTDEKVRINSLQKKQDTCLAQTLSEMKKKTIDPANYKGVINSKNKSIISPKAKNFTKSYNEKMMEPDIDAAVAALSNTEYPIFVIGKEVEDTSNTLNAKKTYTYHMQDFQGNKFSVKFDIPIIIEDRYIYLNGIRSVVENQLIPMPIIKSGPNEVQIIGMYNKIFLRRKETDKLDAKSQVVKKYFLDQKRSSRYRVKIGNCLMKNKNFDTPLDFDNISKNISELTIGKFRFIFDLPKLMEYINEDREKKNQKPILNGYTDNKQLIVGYNIQTKELITVDELKGESVLDKIIEKLPDDEYNEIMKVKPGTTRFTYIKATMKRVEIPIVFFMLYCEGLTPVLEKIGVKYDIVEPGTTYDSFNRDCIKAKDKWIIWDRYPFHNSLLLNGMSLLPTSEYTFEQLDSKTTYVEMVPIFFKESRVAFVLDQFKDFMLDPISIEILKDMNMPTDLNELFVTAAIMLNSNKSDSILDMKNVRIRNNEIFAQFVYKAMADAYLNYRKSIYKKKPDRLIVNRNLVTTNINGSAKTKMSGCKLIEGASSLNPILELEKQGTVSYRGPSGVNRDDAYTLPKRAYNPSMVGIIGISSSPDANVGIQRQLTLNPNIISTRGYLQAADNENIKDLSSADLFTPAELLSPNGVTHDDGQRTAMAYKQSKYMVMTDDAEPVMIGNKVEAAVPYYLSRDFVIVSKEAGKVISLENNMVIVEYESGKYDSFSLDPIHQKNSAGGFYIETQFETKLKVGDSFKKDEVIAYNPKAFSKNTDDLSASMNIGVLCKIAIVPTYDEYEDSAPITKKAAERMATTIVMEQSFVIKKNARVQFIAKKGDRVNVGDKLAVFDDWAEEDEFAKWLSDLGNQMNQNVVENVFTTKESEYAGEIVDVKYYSAVDLEELSDTFKPYVEEYWKKIRKKNNTLKKYKNADDTSTIQCGQIITEKAGKTDATNKKIYGREVEDGVLVRFFIKHKDIVAKGDKLTNYTALKGIVSNVIDEGLEPFSEYRKDEPIDILMAPGAILARKTPSAIISMFGNKCMLELERRVLDIWDKD